MIHLGPFDTQDQLLNAAITLVRESGFLIMPADSGLAWVTPAQLGKCLRIAGSYLTRLLRAPDCPPFFANRGDTGRIIKLQPSPALIDYLAARRDATANYRP
jgi:hypothetical protein